MKLHYLEMTIMRFMPHQIVLLHQNLCYQSTTNSIVHYHQDSNLTNTRNIKAATQD